MSGAGWDDQAQAAVNEAEVMVRRMADRLGTRVTTIDGPRDHSLAASLRREMLAALGYRTLSFCPHLSPLRPEPMFALIGRPTKLLCLRCSFAACLAHSDAHPDTCDVCSETVDSFRELVVKVGAVLLMGHACDRCFETVPVG